jgi:pyruvyltransferase
MIINRLYSKYLKKPLKLYWWRYDYPNKLNFGDEITPLIIERLFGKQCVWSPPNECEVAGAGSILEILQTSSNGNPIRVWGSGFIKKGEVNQNSNLNFLAVRGKLTLDRVNNEGNDGIALMKLPWETQVS